MILRSNYKWTFMPPAEAEKLEENSQWSKWSWRLSATSLQLWAPNARSTEPSRVLSTLPESWGSKSDVLHPHQQFTQLKLTFTRFMKVKAQLHLPDANQEETGSWLSGEHKHCESTVRHGDSMPIEAVAELLFNHVHVFIDDDATWTGIGV